MLKDYIKFKILENIIYIENDVMIYHNIKAITFGEGVIIYKLSAEFGT